MTLTEIIKRDDVFDEQTLCFQTTPLAKIWVLSLLTFGFYDLFLVYSYWKTLREKFGHKVSPLWRAIFLTIMNFSLFPTLKKYFEHYGVKCTSGVLLAFSYLFWCGVQNGLSRISEKTDGLNIAVEIISLIACIFSTFIIVSIQKNINKINQEKFPNAPQNNWKISNTIWTVILAILIVLAYLPA